MIFYWFPCGFKKSQKFFFFSSDHLIAKLFYLDYLTERHIPLWWRIFPVFLLIILKYALPLVFERHFPGPLCCKPRWSFICLTMGGYEWVSVKKFCWVQWVNLAWLTLQVVWVSLSQLQEVVFVISHSHEQHSPLWRMFMHEMNLI